LTIHGTTEVVPFHVGGIYGVNEFGP
jgi:hypothetical protein